MRIDRCVCHDMLFSTLADAARRHGCRTIEELRACSSFGEGCGHCHVYVEQMLKTGQTVFTRLLPRTQRTGTMEETQRTGTMEETQRTGTMEETQRTGTMEETQRTGVSRPPGPESGPGARQSHPLRQSR